MATADSTQMKNGEIDDELRCPICVSIIQTPRALACLHTFCETCLETYIAECKPSNDGNPLTSIKCPVCEHPTTVSNGDKGPNVIAKSLPMNQFILPRLFDDPMPTHNSPTYENSRLKKHTLSPHRCGPCKDRHRSVDADAYCNDCGEYQCEKCVEGHSKVKQFREHTILFIEKSKTHVKTYDYKQHAMCKIHPFETVGIFCSSHDILICTKCVVESHRSCVIINEFDDVGKTLKEGKQSEHLLKNFKGMQMHVEDAIKIIEANDDDINNECDEIMEALEAAKAKMLRLFRSLENSTAKRIREFKRTNEEKNAERILTYKKIDAAIGSSCETLKHVIENGSDKEAFSVFQTLKQQLFEYDDMISMQKDLIIFRSIGLTLNEELVALINSDKSLGEVSEVDVTPVFDELPALRFSKKTIFTDDVDDEIEENEEEEEEEEEEDKERGISSHGVNGEEHIATADTTEDREVDPDNADMGNGTADSTKEEQEEIANNVEDDIDEEPPIFIQTKDVKFGADEKRKCIAAGIMDKKMVLIFEVRSKLRLKYQLSFFTVKTLDEVLSHDIQKDPRDLVILDSLNVVVSYPNSKSIEYYVFTPPTKKRKKPVPPSVTLDRTVKCEIYDATICRLNAEEFGVSTSSYFGTMTHDGIIKRSFYFSRSLSTQETNFWSTQLVVRHILADEDKEIIYMATTKPDKLYSFTLKGELLNIQSLNAMPTCLDITDDGKVVVCCGNTSDGHVVKVWEMVSPKRVDVDLQIPNLVTTNRLKRTMFIIENAQAATKISKYRFPKSKNEVEVEDDEDD